MNATDPQVILVDLTSMLVLIQIDDVFGAFYYHFIVLKEKRQALILDNGKLDEFKFTRAQIRSSFFFNFFYLIWYIIAVLAYSEMSIYWIG